MTAITLKEVGGSVDRVFDRIEDNAGGQSTFVNLATGSFGGARKLIFNVKIPQNLATGRLQTRSRIIVPITRESGLTEVAMMDCTYLVPASFTDAEREELRVLQEYLTINAVWEPLMKNFVLPQ
jgi:hypothetical protein